MTKFTKTLTSSSWTRIDTKTCFLLVSIAWSLPSSTSSSLLLTKLECHLQASTVYWGPLLPLAKGVMTFSSRYFNVYLAGSLYHSKHHKPLRKQRTALTIISMLPGLTLVLRNSLLLLQAHPKRIPCVIFFTWSWKTMSSWSWRSVMTKLAGTSSASNTQERTLISSNSNNSSKRRNLLRWHFRRRSWRMVWSNTSFKFSAKSADSTTVSYCEKSESRAKFTTRRTQHILR